VPGEKFEHVAAGLGRGAIDTMYCDGQLGERWGPKRLVGFADVDGNAGLFVFDPGAVAACGRCGVGQFDQLTKTRSLGVVERLERAAVFFHAVTANKAYGCGEPEGSHAGYSAARHGSDRHIISCEQASQDVGDSIEEPCVISVVNERGEHAVDVKADQ
jgi:hypothetical protein